MAVQSLQDLFLIELSDMYDAENRITSALQQLSSEVTSQQVQGALQQHLQETQQQIKNLEQVFQLCGVQTQRGGCYAIDGLKREHDDFVQQNPAPELLTMFDLGAAAKTEAYEMASYEGLIDKANLMGQQQIAQLLQQNYQQEQAMYQRAKQMSQQLGQQMMSMMGQMGQMGQAGAQP